MKAINYICKIKSENACSIETAEKLTRALHRENLMNESLAIRFRPLFGDFDIVNADFTKVGVTFAEPTTIDQLERAITHSNKN